MGLRGQLRAAVLFVACLSIMSFANKSWAFGKIGHQAIALIAQQNLTPEAQERVAAILGDMSMMDAAEWPDLIKHTSAWQHTAAYHFADTEPGQNYFDDYNNPKFVQTGDLIRALVKAEDILRDSSTSLEQKRYALCFLIHLVGDLHQPLHEGHPEDKGGNEITAEYFGVRTNLHAIWDTNMINDILRSVSYNSIKLFGFETFVPMSRRAPTEQDVENFVSQLRTPRPDEVAAWQDSYLLDWSADSTQIRENIYQDWNGDSQSYQDKYASYVEEKVLMAGYRLAGWLNAIMAGQDFQPEKALELRQEITQRLGGPDTGILLQPASYSQIESFPKFNDPCAHDDDVKPAHWHYNALGL